MQIDSEKSATNDIITREPLTGSRKVYITGENDSYSTNLKVPMREIALTDGTSVTVYDCSGPYTDVNADINVHKGCPISARRGSKHETILNFMKGERFKR